MLKRGQFEITPKEAAQILIASALQELPGEMTPEQIAKAARLEGQPTQRQAEAISAQIEKIRARALRSCGAWG